MMIKMLVIVLIVRTDRETESAILTILFDFDGQIFNKIFAISFPPIVLIGHSAGPLSINVPGNPKFLD
jgi:hypothetical protein